MLPQDYTKQQIKNIVNLDKEVTQSHSTIGLSSDRIIVQYPTS